MQGRLFFLTAKRSLASPPRLRAFTCSSEGVSLKRNSQNPANFKANLTNAENPAFHPILHRGRPPTFQAASLTKNSNLNPNHDSSLQLADKMIWSVERLGKGKWYSDHDRKQAMVPGYVHDQESSQHVLLVMDKYQIGNLWSRLGEEEFFVTIFTLQVYNGFGSLRVLYELPVLPRRVNLDAKGNMCNLGLLKALPGIKLKVDARVCISGQEDCIGLKKGGHVVVRLLHISFFCLPEEVPWSIEIRVNSMDIGDRICLGDLKCELPLHPSSDPASVVCEIV